MATAQSMWAVVFHFNTRVLMLITRWLPTADYANYSVCDSILLFINSEKYDFLQVQIVVYFFFKVYHIIIPCLCDHLWDVLGICSGRVSQVLISVQMCKSQNGSHRTWAFNLHNKRMCIIAGLPFDIGTRMCVHGQLNQKNEHLPSVDLKLEDHFLFLSLSGKQNFRTLVSWSRYRSCLFSKYLLSTFLGCCCKSFHCASDVVHLSSVVLGSIFKSVADRVKYVNGTCKSVNWLSPR
jgi:hypothetical protein